MSNEIMSHEQATRGQAAERYVLCELTADEREAFEGHYFDCPACFERVKLEMQLLRHAREVLDPEPEKGWLARMLGDLRRPVPAFASAMLLCAIGVGAYQQIEIAGLKAPRLEERYTLRRETRGGANLVKWRRNAWVNLYMDVDRKPEFVSYQARFTSSSGKVTTSDSAPAVEASGPLAISVPPGTLDPGKNSVVVYGTTADGRRAEVEKRELELQFVD